MDDSRKICVVDYGVGNLFSVVKALKLFSDRISVTEDGSEILSADALVLPGVGSFGSGMEGLRIRGLEKPIKDFASLGKPVLGICLGAQILLSKGLEFGACDGLDIIKGRVEIFPDLKKGSKIPHIGWNGIKESKKSWNDSCLAGLPGGSSVYFVHSFIMEPDSPKNILAVSEYGGHKFCSAVSEGKILGCQFHPEKSGAVGLSIIKNFVQSI